MTDRKNESPHGWEMALAFCPPEDAPLLGDPGAEPSVASSEGGSEQDAVTNRYDRMAWLYDLYDAPMEWMGTRRRRRRLLAQASGRVLEVGIGTGKNLPFYPPGVEVTGIDISEEMLARARQRARDIDSVVMLRRADVTSLPFPDDDFDTTVATCVFCSVADPVGGLRELGRVTRPGGRILLLEHVRPRGRVLGWLADIATTVTRRIFGFRANRRTEANVVAAHLEIDEIKREGVWREILARPEQVPTSAPAPENQDDAS